MSPLASTLTRRTDNVEIFGGPVAVKPSQGIRDSSRAAATRAGMTDRCLWARQEGPSMLKSYLRDTILD